MTTCAACRQESRRSTLGKGKETYHIAGYELSRKNFVFGAVANDCRSHSNVCFEASYHICGLLFLIPAHACVQTENANNDTKVDPILQASSE